MTKYALISVFDKNGLLPLAKAVLDRGYTIAATAGTGKYLNNHSISYVDIGSISQNPNILRDCLQAFSFHIAGGIVFDRSNSRHLREVEVEHIPIIDIVIMSVTDIKSTVLKLSDFTIQNVDLGGPSILRAAAINYKSVLVVPAARYYQEAADMILHDKNNLSFRKKMAQRTFAETSLYDQQLVNYLSK